MESAGNRIISAGFCEVPAAASFVLRFVCDQPNIHSSSTYFWEQYLLNTHLRKTWTNIGITLETSGCRKHVKGCLEYFHLPLSPLHHYLSLLLCICAFYIYSLGKSFG